MKSNALSSDGLSAASPEQEEGSIRMVCNALKAGSGCGDNSWLELSLGEAEGVG